MRFLVGAWIIFTLSWCQLANAAGPLQFGISPPRFELKITERPQQEVFKVLNTSNETTRFSIEIYHWELDENNEVVVIPPTEQSLDQWVHVNPIKFEVKAKQTQLIRFLVRPKTKPTDGEHRAIIYVTEVPDPKSDTTASVAGRIGVILYGDYGNVQRIGELHSLNIEQAAQQVKAMFDISSKGNAHVRATGYYAVWKQSAYSEAAEQSVFADPVTLIREKKDKPLPDGLLELEKVYTLPVLANTRRTIPLSIQTKLEPGNYVFAIHGDLGDTVLQQMQRFSVK